MSCISRAARGSVDACGDDAGVGRRGQHPDQESGHHRSNRQTDGLAHRPPPFQTFPVVYREFGAAHALVRCSLDLRDGFERPSRTTAHTCIATRRQRHPVRAALEAAYATSRTVDSSWVPRSIGHASGFPASDQSSTNSCGQIQSSVCRSSSWVHQRCPSSVSRSSGV
jgi:hypothetical protein